MKPRLTEDGKKVFEMLKREYGMTDEAAFKMMGPEGFLGRILSAQVAKATIPVQSRPRAELFYPNKETECPRCGMLIQEAK